MQNHAANELHIEVPHVEYTAASFANDGEGLRQDLIKCFVNGLAAVVVKRLGARGINLGVALLLAGSCLQLFREMACTLGNAGAKFVGLGAQFVIRERLHLRLERVDLLNARHQALDQALIAGPKNFCENIQSDLILKLAGRRHTLRLCKA